MKSSRIAYLLVLSIIAALLMPLSATPAHAANEYLFVYPWEGKIGDKFEVDGSAYEDEEIVVVYLSSMEAEIGDQIGVEVTAYEKVVIRAFTDDTGSFERPYTFYLPDALTDGQDVEDVHDGVYYLYAAYYHSEFIVALNELTVINGSIELDIEEGTVGTGVEINGQGLRPNQTIAIEYDGITINIASGDSQTDDNGDFSCAVIIPESSAGSHIINAVDESGNTPEAEFSVTPQIALDPPTQAAGAEVQVSGTGFGNRQPITITLGDEELDTTPIPLNTDHYGSFEGSFLVPFSGSYGARQLEVADSSLNTIEATLTVVGGIYLSPATSPTSPGHAGMELNVAGAGFTDEATVTISYQNNSESIPIAEDEVNEGTFWATFSVPPGPAGSHVITASDGTTTATATFTMESQAPPTPAPLTPEVAETAAGKAYFDWEDVSDDSGVSYTLQVAVDANFNGVIRQIADIAESEYRLTEEEKLPSTEDAAPYYWRVKATDGAANESGWSPARLFYIGFSWSALPGWIWYVLGGVGVVIVGLIGLWLQRRFTRAKIRTI